MKLKPADPLIVEACLKRIPNRYELVIAAAKRAREIAQATDPLDPPGQSFCSIALQEIAEGKKP